MRTITVEPTVDDTQYILHALNEFKQHGREKVEADETGDGELTPMYAGDIMQAKLIFDKINRIAEPVFGKDTLVVSYELL
jgi:hypothetical protein